MSRLCAVVLFFGVSHPRSVSSPSLPHAPLLRLAPSYPPLKVTFSDASPSVSKSCDSFLSVTVVDPPNPSILEIASSLASLSGGFVEVSLPARASFPFTSLSKPLSLMLKKWFLFVLLVCFLLPHRCDVLLLCAVRRVWSVSRSAPFFVIRVALHCK
ncbi:unnamed protein product [Arabidopsis halleri]